MKKIIITLTVLTLAYLGLYLIWRSIPIRNQALSSALTVVYYPLRLIEARYIHPTVIEESGTLRQNTDDSWALHYSPAKKALRSGSGATARGFQVPSRLSAAVIAAKDKAVDATFGLEPDFKTLSSKFVLTAITVAK